MYKCKFRKINRKFVIQKNIFFCDSNCVKVIYDNLYS
nr:MAG TPA: hypothetical protein [Caudoviricetes sp.]